MPGAGVSLGFKSATGNTGPAPRRHYAEHNQPQEYLRLMTESKAVRKRTERGFNRTPAARGSERAT